MSLLSVRALSGGYTSAMVLRDIDLDVEQREIVGVLGANGAGKSTLLRALSGALPTCRGDVMLDGADLSKRTTWARAKAGLAHVPEGRHILAAMTVRENLQVAALVRTRRPDLTQVYELFPRLLERQNQIAGSMSGGEQQMLAIGRALMMAPKIMVIDELSAGLAPVIVDQLVDGLVRLRDDGLAILLVEQSPHFVVDAVDRVYVLEHGRIRQSGTFADLGGVDAVGELYLGIS